MTFLDEAKAQMTKQHPCKLCEQLAENPDLRDEVRVVMGRSDVSTSAIMRALEGRGIEVSHATVTRCRANHHG